MGREEGGAATAVRGVSQRGEWPRGGRRLSPCVERPPPHPPSPQGGLPGAEPPRRAVVRVLPAKQGSPVGAQGSPVGAYT